VIRRSGSYGAWWERSAGFWPAWWVCFAVWSRASEGCSGGCFEARLRRNRGETCASARVRKDRSFHPQARHIAWCARTGRAETIAGAQGARSRHADPHAALGDRPDELRAQAAYDQAPRDVDAAQARLARARGIEQAPSERAMATRSTAWVAEASLIDDAAGAGPTSVHPLQRSTR
jgi:hypothetical protein